MFSIFQFFAPYLDGKAFVTKADFEKIVGGVTDISRSVKQAIHATVFYSVTKDESGRVVVI